MAHILLNIVLIYPGTQINSILYCKASVPNIMKTLQTIDATMRLGLYREVDGDSLSTFIPRVNVEPIAKLSLQSSVLIL